MGFAGFSVGIMWPGGFSKAVSLIKEGGTAMFAFLALAGDLGCAAGPAVVGEFASFFDDNLKIGLLAAIIFPVLLLILMSYVNKNKSVKHNTMSDIEI